MTNIAAIYSEIGTFMLFSLWASFEIDYDEETAIIISWTAIGTLFSIMFVNYIDIVIS